MFKLVIRGMAVLSILATLVFTPLEAQAGKGRWGFGDNRYFVIDRACRDGVSFSAVNSNSVLSLLGQGSFASETPIDLGARLYTTAVTLPDPGTGLTATLYGPELAPLTTFTMPVSTAPFPADVDNSGVVGDNGSEYYDVYMRAEPLFFNQLLTPGQTVVATHISFNDNGVEKGYDWAVVEECLLASFLARVGAVTPVGSAALSAGVMPPGSVNYWVWGTPARGTLRKNNTVLNFGNSFTQSDVANGLITYHHAGSASEHDRVLYGVAGTTRISIDSNEAEALNGGSSSPAISADGRYVAFASAADNLVTGDTNNQNDIFVRDLVAGTTTRVSVATGGAQALNGSSTNPSISADGRYVAFESAATNLVPAGGDSNGVSDIFVRDLVAGTTTRVSVATGGAQAVNGGSFNPAISADGRFVAFESAATNLAGAADTNTCPTYGYTTPGTCPDIFVRDLQTNTTVRISLSTAGAQPVDFPALNPATSASGRFVAFDSFASTLLPLGEDTNTASDIFVRDRDTDGDGVFDEAGAVSTTRVSVKNNGDESSGTNGGAFFPTISGDGLVVAFKTYADDLIGIDDFNGQADIYVRDRQFATTRRVSLNVIGQQASNPGNGFDVPALSADGRFVAYVAYASDVMAGDNNFADDVFVYDRHTGATRLVSAAADGVLGNDFSGSPAVSADGRYVAFRSDSNNLIGAGNDTNTQGDVFLRYVDDYGTLGIMVGYPLYLPVLHK